MNFFHKVLTIFVSSSTVSNEPKFREKKNTIFSSSNFICYFWCHDAAGKYHFDSFPMIIWNEQKLIVDLLNNYCIHKIKSRNNKMHAKYFHAPRNWLKILQNVFVGIHVSFLFPFLLFPLYYLSITNSSYRY